jgi:DNA-binding transcriptional ArsR family regulator
MSSRKQWDQAFKALAHPRRRQILDVLKRKPMTTGKLCNKFRDSDRCTVMLHLSILEKAGLILVKREGRMRWNYLNIVPIKEIFDRWISSYALPSVEMLARLKEDLEGTGKLRTEGVLTRRI